MLLNLMWVVTFQSMDHKHGDLAAKTGSVGTGPDNKWEKLWRLFFFYVPNYFLFIPFLVIQSRDFEPASLCVHVQHASWDIINPVFTSVTSGIRSISNPKWLKSDLLQCDSDVIPCLSWLRWKWVDSSLHTLCSSGYNNTHCLWRSIVYVQ